MSMMKLAFQNFKSSFKSYLSLIISLAFTILVLFNFINLIDSGILDQLGESNARNVEIILQVLSFTIACFMIFFIWYSTNVFLTKRKKEIGIYVFMGLSNQKIGKLYAIETILIGFTSLLLGIVFGIITSQLFTMILMAISEISVEITFHFSLMPMLITSIIFFIIYFVFVVKGYINIVRSSVLEMVSANRQNEYVKQNNTVLIKSHNRRHCLSSRILPCHKRSRNGSYGKYFIGNHSCDNRYLSFIWWTYSSNLSDSRKK